MKKRKGNPLYRMIAVLLSVVLVVEMPQGAGSVNVLAKERISENTTESTEKESNPEDTESIGKESDPEDTESAEKESNPEDTESTEKESDPEDTESTGKETDLEDVEETVSGNGAQPDDEAEMQEVMQAAEVAVQTDFIATGTDWTLDADGKLTIKSDAGMGDWCYSGRTQYKEQIINVEIQEGVTSIRSSAFERCYSLTDIEIPSSVTSIGGRAFSDCSSLTDITIPSGVTRIEYFVFSSCYRLTDIEIPSSVTSIGSNAFEGCYSLRDIEIPTGVTSIEGSAFYGCRSLKNIEIPTGVTIIELRVFFGCSGLTDIKIPTGVTEIVNSAFGGCSSLTDITIPSSVTKIGYSAFKDCSSLTSVTMQGGTPPELDTNVFDYCKFVKDKTKGIYIPAESIDAYKAEWEDWADYFAYNIAGTDWELDVNGKLTIKSNAGMDDWCYTGRTQYKEQIIRVEIQEGVTNIGHSAFEGCSSLTNIDIPTSVTNIGYSAFHGCKSLKNITIPTGVTSIGDATFWDCSSLTSIGIPTSVTSIEYSAFYNCSNLKNITIPTGVTSIGESAFRYCSSLTSIDIPSGVTSIEVRTFHGCSSLTSIDIPSGVTSIKTGAFEDCSSLTSIDIPSSVTSIWTEAFAGCSSLTSMVIPTGVTKIESSVFNSCSSLTSITIPSGVTSIGQATFYKCSSLTNIDIPTGVTSIADRAFEECSSLTDIKIPSNVTRIGNSTFQHCSSLTSIDIPMGVTEIGNSAFSGCSGLTDIKIPTSVTEIRYSAFAGCSSLTSITIPSNVRRIEDYALANCSSLTSVTIQREAPPSLQNKVFHNCKFVTDNTKGIYVPVESVDAYKAQWSEWADYITYNIAGTDWTLDADGKLTIQSDAGMVNWSSSGRTPYGTLVISVEIQEGVTSIEASAFEGCSSLTNITIPSGVTSIGSSAFEGCSSLTSVTMQPTTPPTLDGNAVFTSCKFVLDNTKGIHVPAGTADAYKSASGWSAYQNYITDGTPEITAHPTNQSVKNGEEVTFSVAATGTGEPFTYQWQVDQNDGNGFADINNATSATYTISAVNKGCNGYRYRCVVTNEIGSVTSDVAELTVTDSDADKVAAAKEVVQEVLTGYMATNADTGQDIENKINEALSEAEITDVTAMVKDFTKKEATQREEGSIGGSIVIRCGNESDIVSISLTIDKLPDEDPPTGAITIETSSWTDLLNTVTFELFFKETKQAMIKALDTGSGVDKTYYYVSDRALSEAEVKALGEGTWTEGDSVSISPDRKCVIYAKITDKAGNMVYLSSDGLVFDGKAPVISGVTDGEIYRTSQTVTVTDENLESVKVDGKEVALNDGQFTLEAVSGAQTITATDRAGNTTTVTVTVKTEEETVEDIEQIVEDTLEDVPVTEDTTAEEIMVAIIATLAAAGITGLIVEVMIAAAPEAGMASISAVISGMGGGLGGGMGNPSGGGGESNVREIRKEKEKELHTHEYGIMWKSDLLFHWHECICGAKADKMIHCFGEWKVTKPATENEEGSKERICVICGRKDSEKIPKTTHTHSYGSEWMSDDTNHWHECDCGAKAEEAAHSFGEWTIRKAATKDEYGIKERICVICRYKEIEVIPKKTHSHSYGSEWKYDGANHWHECRICKAKAEEAAHSFGEWTVTKPATADEYGVQERMCAVCGYTDTEIISKTTHTHSYGMEWESDGTNHWHECNDCGAKAEEAAHSFGEWTVRKRATEDEYGIKERVCAVCGYKETKVIPKTTHKHSYGNEWESDDTNHWHECDCGAKAEEAAHSFGEWTVTKSATADEYGIKERVCAVCGYKETEVIPKTTHVHSYGSEWEYDGANHWHECSDCGAKAEEAAHSFGEWTVKKPATADEYGVQERICAVCQYKETEVIPSTSHVHSYGSEWEYDGTNHWHECSSCGAKAEKAAHSYGVWTVKKNATADEYGVRERICVVCKYRETEVIPSTSHVHSYGSEWKFDGTKHWHECSGCGAKAEKAAHSFGAWMVKKSATADEYGVQERICVVCQYKEIEVIPSTSHVHSYGSEWEYDDVNHWHKCSVCRAKAEVSVHSYGEWTVKKPATADEYGVQERICAVCKYKETEVIPSTSHVHSYGNEWEYDGTKHWHECSSCGAKAEKAAHSYGEWTVKKPATGDEEGIRDRICAVCKYKETEVIPIITQGYSYGSIPDQTYTGLSIKLSEDVLKIYHGTTRLTAGVDYSVSYKNNKAVGTATVTIKGKGNYKETETIQFNIVPKNIADTDVEITYNEYVKSNTKEQKPLSKITYNGKKLTTKDYEVEYYKLENNQKTGNALKGVKEAGDYQMVITGMKNYTGTATKTIHVVDTGTFMNTLKITLTFEGMTNNSIAYTGTPIEPKVEVTDKDGTPVDKENYEVTFSNNTNVGTANVIIIGEPNNGYYGSVTKTFKITGTALSSVAKVSTAGWQSKVAIDPVSGTAEQPGASLVPKRSSDPELAEGTDYTVSYSNNTRPGTATVTFTGMGRYTGSLKKTFKVTAVAWTKADLENETLIVDVNNTAPFAKKGAQPAVTVTYKNMKLTAGRDYKVTYSNNKAVTTASTKKKPSVTIVGMGIYSGTIKDAKEFTIEKADLATAGITLTVRDAVYSGQNGSFISKPVVKEADGTILTEGANKDYTVKYSVVENGVETEKNANDAALDKNTIVKVTVSAASGNYTGSISKEYKVVAASIRSATIIAKAQTYTGKEVTLSAADFSKARIGKTPLVYGVDYEIVPGSYEKNINKGNATVTIRGIGNYGDEKKVTFRITSATLKWWSDLFS